ncbi:MAG: Gfo/Idh/MocA family oxidoreductase [Anaerolineae bacterium]|nr:Gfo/Idh/MocA family oxidoreductase [Anaerolineae bacterium]
MKPLRTAIVGCGHFARKQHAERLAALTEQVRLVGFCDQEVGNAIAFNQQFAGGRGATYEDCRRMFEELGLDLVYICLPPFAHGDEVELACRYGVHFLIEKPIALTLELAAGMVEAVRKSGVKSQVGFMWRHGEAALWLKQQMHAAGAERAFISGSYFCNALHRWWWRDRSKSGGQLVEQVIHLLDLTRFYLGEAVSVYSAQDNLFHRQVADYTAEDASATVIRFAAGGLAVLAASNGAIPNRWESQVRVCLPGITADLTDPNHGVFHHTSGQYQASTTVAAEKDVYLAETLDLLAAIREDRPAAVPIEEGFRSLRLALAAARSAELKAPVDIPLAD